MQIAPYLNFNGNCREAFTFYAGLLGGHIEMIQTHGTSPMADQVPPEWQDKIMHVSMRLGEFTLMGSDAPAQYFRPAEGLWVSLAVDEPAEAQRIFDALAKGGSVQMALEKTFWARSFGMVKDRFGTPWMINCT